MYTGNIISTLEAHCISEDVDVVTHLSVLPDSTHYYGITTAGMRDGGMRDVGCGSRMECMRSTKGMQWDERKKEKKLQGEGKGI